MTDQPDIVTEIVDLLSQIRSISHPAAADPTTRAELLARKAELLARKADLLARIAADNTNRWTSHHAEQARQVAQEAQTVATQARDLAAKANRPTLDHHESPSF